MLEAIGLAAEALDLLVVDAEGCDGEIVLGFLDVGQSEPIVYEQNVMPAEDRESLLGRLAALGYVTWQAGDDHIAAQPHLLENWAAVSTVTS